MSNPILTETEQARKPPMVLHHFPCAMLECRYILDFNNSPKNFSCSIKQRKTRVPLSRAFISSTSKTQKEIENILRISIQDRTTLCNRSLTF